ncbi:acyltransferase family protein [Croceibacterium ferulae]|uniref:acyltransferase family protein n=1 Tax=Croceibacterium ferulae TaxID=1854641 RepID=UPI000EB4FC96|nr:acyltransferase [Croceibacterium ferulae]
MRRKAGELVGIQHLRGIAALMVVVFHLLPPLARMGYSGGWPTGLAGGVDIFFVISGCIMWITTDLRPQTPLQFLRQRIIRLVPLYWAVTTFTLILLLLAPGLLQTARFDAAHVTASYLFVAWPHPVTPALEPLVIPGWTLNYEMYFYLLFALALPLAGRARIVSALGGLALVVVAGSMLRVPPASLPGFYTAPILLEFAYGLAIGWLFTRTDLLQRLPAHVAGLLVAAGLAALLALPVLQPGWPRFVAWGLPAAAILSGTLALELHNRVPRLGLLHALGTSSYSLYLVHPMCLAAITRGWQALGPAGEQGLLGFGIVAVIGCCLAGAAVFLLVEAPLQRLLRPRGAPGMASRLGMQAAP